MFHLVNLVLNAFPYMFNFSTNAYYYFPNPSPGHYTTDPRVFVNLTTGMFVFS